MPGAASRLVGGQSTHQRSLDSLTLLALPSASDTPRQRPRSLRTDDGRYVVLVRVFDQPEGPLLQVRVYIDTLGFLHLALDGRGALLTTVIDARDGDATTILRKRLADEHGITLDDDGWHLLADHVNGDRRTSVLRSDDCRLSLRAKVHFDEDGEEALVRLRLFIDGLGALQIVASDNGRVLASISGRTDSDAYERIRGELARKGIELD